MRQDDKGLEGADDANRTESNAIFDWNEHVV